MGPPVTEHAERDLSTIRFLVIGAWNTVFGVLAFALADATVGQVMGYPVALTLAFAAAIPQAHLSQRVLVWRSAGPYVPELVRFSGVFLGAFVVNLLLLVLAVEVLEAATLPAQIVISGLIAVSTLVIHRTWTFRHRPPSASGTDEARVLTPSAGEDRP